MHLYGRFKPTEHLVQRTAIDLSPCCDVALRHYLYSQNGQLDPVRFGLQADTASFNREQLVPFTSWSFPSIRIGVEFYF
jgi:hypothetical protein